MELEQLIRTLRRRWGWVLCVVLCAFLAGYAATHRLVGGSLRSRSYSVGAAQAQFFVDSTVSALGDLGRDTAPLADRAQLYAQFMRSNAVLNATARRLGVAPESIAVQIPNTAADGTQNIPRPAPARSIEVRGERLRYRLAFSAQPTLPIVNVYGQAPTAIEALRLVDAAVVSLRNYVATLEASQEVPEKARTRLVELGSSEAVDPERQSRDGDCRPRRHARAHRRRRRHRRLRGAHQTRTRLRPHCAGPGAVEERLEKGAARCGASRRLASVLKI